MPCVLATMGSPPWELGVIIVLFACLCFLGGGSLVLHIVALLQMRPFHHAVIATNVVLYIGAATCWILLWRTAAPKSRSIVHGAVIPFLVVSVSLTVLEVWRAARLRAREEDSIAQPSDGSGAAGDSEGREE